VFYGAVAGGEPFADFGGIVIEGTHTAAVGDASALVNHVEAFGPRRVGEVGGVAHVVDSEGQIKFEALDEIVGDDDALRECLRLGVADVIFIFQIRFHLPFIGGMGFAHVDGQEIRVVFVVFIKLNDVADLATKGRSSKTAEDENERAVAGAFTNVKTVDAVERDDTCVRRVAAHFQIAAMHVRQGVANHAVGVLRASRHVGEKGECADKQNGNDGERPFPETIHAGLLQFINSNVRSEIMVLFFKSRSLASLGMTTKESCSAKTLRAQHAAPLQGKRWSTHSRWGKVASRLRGKNSSFALAVVLGAGGRGKLTKRDRPDLWLRGGIPLFLVSVASKGVSWGVSLLDATLPGRLVNVADKGFTERPNVQTSTRLNIALWGPAFPAGPESAIAEAMAGKGGYTPHQNGLSSKQKG